MAKKIDRQDPPRHKPLAASPEGRVLRQAPGVDFQEGERERAKAPLRPPGWKPRYKNIGPMTVTVRPPRGLQEPVPLKVTLALAHRPRKAEFSHVERTGKAERLEAGVVFDEVPAGDYALICQPKGYRPFVQFVRFTRRRSKVELGSPFGRADSPEEEETLLRPGERHPFIENTRRFLAHFGYLDESAPGPTDALSEPVSAALRRFQRFFGLRATGGLTVETLVLMMRPRCSNPDIPPRPGAGPRCSNPDIPLRPGAGPRCSNPDIPPLPGAGPRFANPGALQGGPSALGASATGPAASSAGPAGAEGDPIVFMGNRWDSHGLRYRLFDGTADISNEWSVVRAAMDTWAQASPLSFSQVSGSDSDLEFDFRRPGESGYPFDSGGNKDGNILAHAWGPTNGTVEFDDHEDWGSRSLPAVATHEIGHALGLAHSGVGDATMYPWYDGGQASLHEVDVRGIKSLYAPTYRHNGPFVTYPLYAFQSEKGTDSVTIDLGETRHFLAWGTVTMIDSLADLDRDNMAFIDVYEVDGVRTGWTISGGDHFGSSGSPANVYQGAYAGYGRRVTFRITAGHVGDLEASGHAIVLVLD